MKIRIVLLLFGLVHLAGVAQPQRIGEVLLISNSGLKKELEPDVFQKFINEVAPSWNKKNQGTNLQLFKADRGDRNGEFLLVCSAPRTTDRAALPAGSPFTDKILAGDQSKASDYLINPGAYTEYKLIGPEKFKSLPLCGILGIHYIKVKKERSSEFEKFVVEKLHPAVSQLLLDMQMLYYKATAGENAGSYITIFTIESVQARDKYWPAGAPETEILKQAFKPLKELALELSSYFVADSYLKPESGGAAAYFESIEWTDFILQPTKK